jgi:O-antigen/teichoic acid export membrane protein
MQGLKPFIVSGGIRVFGILLNLLLIFVSGRYLGITGFGRLSAVLSVYMLAVFFLTAIETREIVRIIGSSKYSKRWAQRHIAKNLTFQNLVLAPLLLLACLAIYFVNGLSFFIPLIVSIYFVRASAVLSAVQRGLGAFIIGNTEATLIRPAATLLALAMLIPLAGLAKLETVALAYLLGAVLGTLYLTTLSCSHFSRPTGAKLPKFGGFQLGGLFILSAIDALLINYDVFIASLVYPPEIIAELRFGFQVKILALLPAQVFLMYNMNRLSGIFIGKQTHFFDNIHRSLIAMRLAAPLYIIFIFFFGLFAFQFVFDQTLSKPILAWLLAPALLTLLLGPIAEFYVSARLERSIALELKILFVAYFLTIPAIVLLFKPAFLLYVATNAILLSLFLVTLFRKFPERRLLNLSWTRS